MYKKKINLFIILMTIIRIHANLRAILDRSSII